MANIESDITEAAKKATTLKTATDTLKEEHPVLLDNKTTVSGNKDAKEAIQTAKEMAKQIAEATSVASTQLHSVAKAFEAIDQMLGQQFHE